MWSELGPLHKPYGCVVDVLVPPLTAGVGGATESLDYTLDPFPSNKVASIQPWYEDLFLVLMEFVMPGSVNIPGRPALCFVLFLFFLKLGGGTERRKGTENWSGCNVCKNFKATKIISHTKTHARTHKCKHTCTRMHTNTHTKWLRGCLYHLRSKKPKS